MIRRFFVDCVIVAALCAVVWGAAPVLFSQDSDPRPVGGITDPTFKNSCCAGLGLQQPCIDDRTPHTKWCMNPGNVDCSRRFLSCTCWDWGTRNVDKKWTWCCGCA